MLLAALLVDTAHKALVSSCEVTTSKIEASLRQGRLLLPSASLQILKVRVCIQSAVHTDVVR